MKRDGSRLRMAALAALLAAGAAALITAQTATAAPTVAMSATATPIPKNPLAPHGSTWLGSGNLAGAAAELQASFTIKGTEDLGLPNPLRRVVIYLPKGVMIHKSGFGACKPARVNWYHTGQAPPCPKDSFAGALTEQHDMSWLGESMVPYPIKQGALFAPGGGLSFWMLGVGRWLGAQGTEKGGLKLAGGPYSYKLTENLPYLYILKGHATGLPDLSTEAITVALGAAYRQGGKLVSLVTMPKRCPAGGFPVKAQLSFGREAQTSWETVTVSTKEPCPRR